jgi:MEDS: MEthanogen/methylotroph, DcmR Sensory domain
MAADIHVAAFRKGDHICLFYKNVQEQLATAVPFVQAGLLRDERCLCVLPKEKTRMLVERLEHRGINTRKEIHRGALMACTPEEAYLKGGAFDREQMAKLLDQAMHESLKLGFTGLRGTGDLSWAVNDANWCGQIVEYEKSLDKYYPGKPTLGICMYDARRFDEARLNKILEAHRLALTNSAAPKRTIRIRNGHAFGDVVFDRMSPTVFHYTIQQSGKSELVTVGQESSLTGAMDSVESILRSLAAPA